VPTSFWKSLFVTGHGFWSSLENVVLGPFLAIISFVCSIGNVPLAAALWTGGISFGGTVAFVFADLIALPLLLIYRKYYGLRLTAKLLAVFWATMSIAGLATEYLFRGIGIEPATGTGEHGMIGRDVWGWNYTTILDFIALAAFAGIYWLYRNRERFGGGSGYAKDPVCGMQVEITHAPATLGHEGHTYRFCSDHCAARFSAAPDRFTNRTESRQEADAAPESVDPVCGMTVDPTAAAATARAGDRTYYFCSQHCADRFKSEPERFAAPQGPPRTTGSAVT
jgi:YHS domain-containing protein